MCPSFWQQLRHSGFQAPAREEALQFSWSARNITCHVQDILAKATQFRSRGHARFESNPSTDYLETHVFCPITFTTPLLKSWACGRSNTSNVQKEVLTRVVSCPNFRWAPWQLGAIDGPLCLHLAIKVSVEKRNRNTQISLGSAQYVSSIATTCCTQELGRCRNMLGFLRKLAG